MTRSPERTHKSVLAHSHMHTQTDLTRVTVFNQKFDGNIRSARRKVGRKEGREGGGASRRLQGSEADFDNLCTLDFGQFRYVL